jgi:hypothetical protein
LVVSFAPGSKFSYVPAWQIFSHFNVDDEYLSNYINDNVAKYAKLTLPLWDGEMIESNLMHNINGLMYGNNVNFMCRGDKVRWYVFAFGTEVDMHTAHWHGQTGVCYANAVLNAWDMHTAHWHDQGLHRVPDTC